MEESLPFSLKSAVVAFLRYSKLSAGFGDDNEQQTTRLKKVLTRHWMGAATQSTL
jgi:hypothetical protein